MSKDKVKSKNTVTSNIKGPVVNNKSPRRCNVNVNRLSCSSSCTYQMSDCSGIKESTVPTLRAHSQMPKLASKTSTSTDQRSLAHVPQRRKTIILSDSHGRHLSSLLHDKCAGTCNVLGYVKPNATFSQVISNLDLVVSGLNKDDFLIVCGGTNDVNSGHCGTTLSLLVKELLNKTMHTNLILIGIPYRFDNKSLNSHILHINRTIYNDLSHYDHAYFLSLDSVFKQRFYTKFGLHFNMFGKKVIVRQLINLTDLATSATCSGSMAIPVLISGANESFLKVGSPPEQMSTHDPLATQATHPLVTSTSSNGNFLGDGFLNHLGR